MRRGDWLIFATMVLVTPGCGSDPDSRDTGSTLCDTVTFDTSWLNTGRPFFRTYCTSCHAEDATERFGAPEGVDFDSEQDVQDYEERIYIRVLDEGTMPLGGGIPEEDLELLEIYLECGL